jgi:hypothetical protein
MPAAVYPPGHAHLMRHPRDPIAPHKAAALFGRLTAQGLLGAEEAAAALIASAARARNLDKGSVDRRGLHIRLLHAQSDAREYWLAQRRRAAWRIRDAIAPLFAARATRADILAAAAAADTHDALLAHERDALAQSVLRRFLKSRA